MTRIIILILFSISLSYGQSWQDQLLSNNPNATYEEKFNAFNAYKEKNTYTKGNGYNPYARNIDFVLQRVSGNKEFPFDQLYKEWEKEKEKHGNFKSNTSSNWTALGPINTPIILSNGKKRGNGRINCIAFDPIDQNIIWVGSPGGGLWKSVDGGSNWTTSTDDLPVIGVSSIAINPNNSQEMYIATGDAHADDTYSIGLMKSNDYGVSWNTTAISYNITSQSKINKVIINPNYTDSIYVVTDNHILISGDGANSFIQATDINGNILVGRFRDIELHPSNPSIIYAVKQTFGGSKVIRSVNGGATWIWNNNGITASSRSRPLLAVTPANPDVVYVLFSANDYSYHGLYKSIDQGSSWSLQSDSPNILGRATDGSSTGGQSWYDLSLGVSTEDENLIYVGGINLWKTTDGGISWGIEASSGNSSNYSYMHVDQHAVEFNPLNNIAYAGNDGGFYKYMNTLNTWVDISDGLEISQFYKLGLSETNTTRVVAGAQDNGTEMLTSGVWDAIRGSDGMECAIDPYDEDIIYSTSQYGGLRKTYNGGNNWDNVEPVSYGGAWVTPWKIHPANNNLIVAGYKEVYSSQTGGGVWDSLTYNISNGALLQTIALAPSNQDYIYASSYTRIEMTKDGGNSWTNIKQGLPNFNISDITVSNDDADRVWVTFSEYNANKKVYESLDGGNSWTNISGTNLPNLPVNCIIHQKLAKDDLYIGTDVGVYHKDNTMTEWMPYMSGLPNVVVQELEIQYGIGKIRAATFGRGIWESDVNSVSTNLDEITVNSIDFYPNPASTIIYFNGDISTVEMLNIYTVTGKLILSSQMASKINVSKLKKGCYIIEFKTKRKTLKRDKLIIK
jgi:photosystem II stability/assembly factor-like uncharacterized protein